MSPAASSIKICMGSSCFSRGNGLNIELIQRFLEEKKLDITIAFSGTLCEGMCKDGPIIIVDDRVYRHVMPADLQDILAPLAQAGV